MADGLREPCGTLTLWSAPIANTLSLRAVRCMTLAAAGLLGAEGVGGGSVICLAGEGELYVVITVSVAEW